MAAFAWAVLGFAAVGAIPAIMGGPIFRDESLIPQDPMLAALMFLGGIAFLAIRRIPTAAARWAGHAVIDRREHPRGVERVDGIDAPSMLDSIALAPVPLGLALGLPFTLAYSARPDEDNVWDWAVPALVVCAVAAAALLAHAVVQLRLIRERRLLDELIIRNGHHSVARVETMRYTRSKIDDRSEFVATLVSDGGGERSEFEIRVVEYPAWAPIPGTEYDMWTIEDLPPGDCAVDEIVVERRYTGPAPNADEHRHRTESLQRLMPAWATPDPDGETVLGQSPHGRWSPLWTRGALVGIVALAAILTAWRLPDAGRTTIALGLFLAAAIADAVLAGARLRRRSWTIRSGVPSAITGPASVAAPVLTIVAMIADGLIADDVLGRSPDVLAPTVVLWVAVAVATWLSVTASDGPEAPHAVNADTGASPEAVQHALTTHDPSAAERLEAETGAIVGVGLADARTSRQPRSLHRTTTGDSLGGGGA